MGSSKVIKPFYFLFILYLGWLSPFTSLSDSGVSWLLWVLLHFCQQFTSMKSEFNIPCQLVWGLRIPKIIEVFYLNSTLNFGIPPVLVFQLEVCYKVDRLLTGITAQQKGTTARWYSNKTSLTVNPETISSWEYDNDYRDILRIALTSYL